MPHDNPHDSPKDKDQKKLTPPTDPLPDPEPSVPSLDQPDPGVFHHNPVKPQVKPQQAAESFTATSHSHNRLEIHLL
jgi:hypothetical protein